MRRYQRRGVMLTLVIIVMGIVGGLLSILMMNTVALNRDRQINRIRAAADAIADSGAAYARAHAVEWATSRPAEAIELDVAALLPAHISGTARLDFPAEQPKGCRLRVAVQNTGHHAERELDIALQPEGPLKPSASAPAAL
jgi:hypothetical protein